jgi:hypothetical protein
VYDWSDERCVKGVLRVQKDGRYGVIDGKTGKEIVAPEYDYVVRLCEGIVAVALHKRWGLADASGKLIVPIEYNKIDKFSDSPKFKFFVVRKDDKQGIVDKHGKFVLPLEYDRIMTPGSTGTFFAKLNGKWGFFDSHFKPLTPFKYDNIGKWLYLNALGYEKIRAIHGNLTLVRAEGKYGFLDGFGNESIPLQYDNAAIFHDNIACVKQNGKYGIINERGEVVVPLVYDDELVTYLDMMRTKQNGLYGYLDHSGKVKIPFIYEESEDSFRDGRALAKLNGKWGYINEAGETVIPFRYEKLLRFRDSQVYNGCDNLLVAAVLNDKTGFIDFNGKVVIPFMYDNDFPNEQVCAFNHKGTAGVSLNGKWGVIDTNNQVVVPFKYSGFERAGIYNYITEVDGKKIYLDNVGNEWELAKNPKAPTLYTLLQTLTWEDVKPFLDADYENWFNKLKQTQPLPTNCIISINKSYDGEHAVEADLLDPEGRCSYLCDWRFILDHEVRVEDNLQISAAEIFGLCPAANDNVYDIGRDSPDLFGEGGLEYIKEEEDEIFFRRHKFIVPWQKILINK